jgi:hypothetical protein
MSVNCQTLSIPIEDVVGFPFQFVILGVTPIKVVDQIECAGREKFTKVLLVSKASVLKGGLSE